MRAPRAAPPRSRACSHGRRRRPTHHLSATCMHMARSLPPPQARERAMSAARTRAPPHPAGRPPPRRVAAALPDPPTAAAPLRSSLLARPREEGRAARRYGQAAVAWALPRLALSVCAARPGSRRRAPPPTPLPTPPPMPSPMASSLRPRRCWPRRPLAAPAWPLDKGWWAWVAVWVVGTIRALLARRRRTRTWAARATRRGSGTRGVGYGQHGRIMSASTHHERRAALLTRSLPTSAHHPTSAYPASLPHAHPTSCPPRPAPCT